MSSEGRLLMTDNTTLAPILFARRYSFDSRSRVVVVSLCCALNLTSTEDELLKALESVANEPFNLKHHAVHISIRLALQNEHSV